MHKDIFRIAVPNIISNISVPLMGITPGTVKNIHLLASGKEIPISTSWVHSDYPHIVFADLGPDPVLPDSTDTVLCVELK